MQIVHPWQTNTFRLQTLVAKHAEWVPYKFRRGENRWSNANYEVTARRPVYFG